MRIAIIGPANPIEFEGDLEKGHDFPAGLGGTPVNSLVRSLLDLGHEVALFTVSPDLDQPWRARGKALQLFVVPYRKRARARALDFFRAERSGLRSELESFKADVYHAHWTYEFALASLDACVHPLLITAHDAPLTVLRRMPDPYRAIRALMALKVRKQARNLTAVTPYLAARWRSEMRYRNNIAIITNPMPSLDASKQSDSGKLVVLDVANASRLKNVRTLIRAFALVVDGLPNAELRLVGPGLAQRGEMHRWAASKHLDRNVRFIGNLERSALANEYESATVLCHPSREESQGIVLLEAMQAGLPIIAGRDSGAVAWTLFDGEAGTLVDANNPNELARAILSLHNEPNRAAVKSLRAKQLAATRYPSTAIARQYLAAYGTLIDAESDDPRGRVTNCVDPR